MIRLRNFIPIAIAALLLAGSAFVFAASAERTTPRNIIIVIGDGMGFNHVAAAGFQSEGKRRAFAFQRFPVRAAVSTYPLYGTYDTQSAWGAFAWMMSGATDSAAAATALSTGHKTVNGAIGVDVMGKPLQHLFEAAEKRGMATGVVTTVPWSHATPAGFVAHNRNRGDYEGIAREMVQESACEVIMGAGNPYYDDDGRYRDAPLTWAYVGGQDTWAALKAGDAGNDSDGDGDRDPWVLIEARESFRRLRTGGTPKRVLGTARAHSTLQQNRALSQGQDTPFATALNQGVPTLREMSLAALNVLDNDEDGFCLMIEGGAIDKAAHAHQTGRMIEETLALGDAVDAVTHWIEQHGGWEKNLLIVTADHETGYLWGPGSNPGFAGIGNNGAGTMPDAVWYSWGHSNSLVPFYAKGAGARDFIPSMKRKDLRRGKYLDNTDIARQLFRQIER